MGKDQHRILHTSSCASPTMNGVVVALNTMCATQAHLGSEVRYIAPMTPGHQPSEIMIPWPSVNRAWIERLAPSAPADYQVGMPFPHVKNHVWKQAQAFAPTVLHAQHPVGVGAQGLLLGKHLNLPVVATWHTDYIAYAEKYAPNGLKRAAKQYTQHQVVRFFNQCTLVIAPSRWTYNLMRKMGVKTQCEVLPSPTELLPSTLRTSEHRRRVRADLNIPVDATIVAFSGRIAKEKNLELLFGAFRVFLRRYQQAHLILIGDGPDRAYYAHYHEMHRIPNVHFLGAKRPEAVKPIIAAADMYVFPSLTDTQGLSLIEALACGVPAVAIEGTGAAESIRNNEDGCIVSASATDVAYAMLQIAWRQETMSAAAYYYATERTPEVYGEKLERIYWKAIDLHL